MENKIYGLIMKQSVTQINKKLPRIKTERREKKKEVERQRFSYL